MRAVVLRRTGGPEVLAVEELPDPQPGLGEVLVDVAFSGCNWADVQIRQGLYPHDKGLPIVVGFEISGTVATVGRGVDPALLGERVAAIVPAGGYADRVVVAAQDLLPLPEGMSLEQGAAFPIQGLTAYHLVNTVYRVQSGDAVLCHAIGGGVGQLVTQLAVGKGARVFGTVGTPGKEAAPLAYGAERVINTRDEDFVEVLEDLVPEGFDLVIDSLGATTLDRSYALLRPLGHVISIGEAEGMPFPNIRERLLPKSLTFTRFHLSHLPVHSEAWREGWQAVTQAITGGMLHVPVVGIHRLADAGAAHRALEGRQVRGKVLLSPQAD